MPARNTGRFIGQALKSVCEQKGIDFEVIVVDDASEDDTATIVANYGDSRIRLIRNERRLGISACHNRVVAESTSPFIAHVDSDDVILPGALRKMTDALRASPRVGMVHCHFFDIDEWGRASREAFRRRRKDFLTTRPPGMDYRRQLLVMGSVASALRTYRRQTLHIIGKFNESLEFGEDYEMALRIADKFEIRVVPEFLYLRRIHKANTWESQSFKNVRSWCLRYRTVRRLVRNKQLGFVHLREYSLNRLALISLFQELGFPRLALALNRAVASLRSKMALAVHRFAWEVYHLALKRLSWWPIDLVKGLRRSKRRNGHRVAYYLWHFPTLSQTFIQREVSALLNAGIDIHVFADAPEDIDLLEGDSKTLIAVTDFLDPENRERFLRYRNRFSYRNPLLYVSLYLYVVLHRYGAYKTPREDMDVFHRAIYLAGWLEDADITRVHAPWADKCAFIALVASRLAGLPFSVQARAHDLHRRPHRYALREKFENADFVLTNSRYNERHIRSIVNSKVRGKIHTIYEGLDTTKLLPVQNHGSPRGPTRILSVARLIEEKGLHYLLQACRLLRDRGYTFHCQVIGGPELPTYAAYYVELKKLHMRLKLEDCVFFLGAQPFTQVVAAYRWADMFVLPCVMSAEDNRDITPNSLIEAMAMELPVISTRQTAIPEIVDDGVNGILVDPNDEQLLADAMLRLIENPSLRMELGSKARKKVEQRFDINTNINKYVGFFMGYTPQEALGE